MVYGTKQKRSRSGPAKLTMMKSLYKSMKVYVEKVRPLFANPKEEAVFITKGGGAFKDGTIGKRVTSWWREAKNVTYSAKGIINPEKSRSSQKEKGE